MARRAPANTKEVILACARACFVERGVDATTVEAITTRAGVAKGAFYTYFDSKDACWTEVLTAFVQQLHAGMQKAPVQPPKTLADGLANDLDRTILLLELCWENRDFVRMILGGGAELAHHHLLDELGKSARQRSLALRTAAVSSGVGRADLDVAVVSAFVTGGYEALVRELISRPEKPDIAAWCRVAEQTWQLGFLTETARTHLASMAPSGGDAPPKPKRPSKKSAPSG